MTLRRAVTTSRLSTVPSTAGRRGYPQAGAVALGLWAAWAALALAPTAHAQCAPVDIAANGVASGSLSNGDCTIAQLGLDENDTSFVDVYRVTLPTDGFLTVSLDSPDFDAFLGMYDETLTDLLAISDDGGAGSNSKIDRVPFDAGTYLILANSFFLGETGSYTLTTLLENTGNPACNDVVDVPTNSVSDGSLAPSDCTLAQLGIDGTDESLVDQYRVTLSSGGSLTAALDSFSFDAFLWLFDETLTNVIDTDDDGGGGENARLDSIPLTPGTYVILANTFFGGADNGGPYTLTLIPEPTGSLLWVSAIGSVIALSRLRNRKRSRIPVA